MPSIIERLPDPSALESEIAPVLDKFVNLSAKALGFSPADLGALLNAGKNLPIPSSLVLIADTLNSLDKMAYRIPSNPEQLTALLKEGLERLKTDTNGISELLGPVAKLVSTVAPALEKFDLLQSSVTRMNDMLSGLSDKASGLNLANLPEQLEYFSRMFEVFPEVSNVSPIKELKAQIDTFKAWMTTNAAELTELFRGQIQTLAEAVPSQLDQVMLAGIDALALIEAPLPALEHSAWCAPYNQALDAVAAIDLDDLSGINDYLMLLNDKVTQVTVLANTVTQKAQEATDALQSFDVNLFSQNLSNALFNILSTVSPEKPGILAVLFSHISRMIGGLEIGAIKKEVASFDQKIEGLIGKMNLTEFAATIESVTSRITSAVASVDQALVEVATVLSNLVAELQNLITGVNLPGLMSQVRSAFTQLSNTVNGLLSQVTSVQEQINDFVTGVGQDIDSLDLDLDALTGAIRELLAQITSVLKDPQIRKILEEAQQGIDAMAKNLESVTLKPIFDQVNSGIEDLKKKLATVDLSELNDFLKAALFAALEIIRRIDFPADVAKVLIEQLQDILLQPTDLLKQLQQKYQKISTHLEQFKPGNLASQKLSPSFEAVMEELNKIEPGKVLQPLKDLHTALLAQLQPVNPQNLLSPLIDVHQQLISRLQALSPHDLIAPLNQLLSEVTGLLDQLGIDALINNITGSVNKINDLISQFSLGDQIRNTPFWGVLEQLQIQSVDFLAGAENQIDLFLDKIVELIPSVVMSTLQPALETLRAAITAVENHVNTPEALTHLDTIKAALDTQNFKGKVTDLTKRWLEQKKRFEDFSPPAEFADDYETLKQRVQALSPIVRLAAPATLVDRLHADVETALSSLNRNKQSLINLLAEGHDKLQALLPAEFTAEAFKMMLREDLEEQLGEPAKNVLQLMQTRVQDFGEVMNAIKAIALKFRAPFEALTIIPSSIGQVGNALIGAKNKITGVNLDFLEDELQGVLNAVIAQLNDPELNPTTLIDELTTDYTNMLSALDGLYPETAINNLDVIYKDTILKKIAELHPDQTVAAPLNEEYQKIVALQGYLSIDKIFDALNEKLKTIDQELDEGLTRTGKAFNGLLAALPS